MPPAHTPTSPPGPPDIPPPNPDHAEQPPRRGLQRKHVVLAVFIFLVAMTIWRFAIIPEPTPLMGWDTNIDPAEAAIGTPALVYVGAEWCPGCRAIKKDVLSDEQVRDRLSGDFKLIQVDLTYANADGQNIAERYGVTGIPALLAFDDQGTLVGQMSGYASQEALFEWVDRIRPTLQSSEKVGL